MDNRNHQLPNVFNRFSMDQHAAGPSVPFLPNRDTEDILVLQPNPISSQSRGNSVDSKVKVSKKKNVPHAPIINGEPVKRPSYYSEDTLEPESKKPKIHHCTTCDQKEIELQKYKKGFEMLLQVFWTLNNPQSEAKNSGESSDEDDLPTGCIAPRITVDSDVHLSLKEYKKLMDTKNPKDFVRDLTYKLFSEEILIQSTITGNSNTSKFDNKKINIIQDWVRLYLKQERFAHYNVEEKQNILASVKTYVGHAAKSVRLRARK